MLNGLTKIAEDALLVITMPNADTFGSIFRDALFQLKESSSEKVILIENFGKLNYFAAMRYCKFLIGNTSSGIIEAASFGKYVVNVGDRQDGRAQSENMINVPFVSDQIIKATRILKDKLFFEGSNIYQKDGTAELILKYLKN